MNNGVSPNPIFDKVLSFIDYSNQHIFLTGKAGTGKTTLLKHIKANSSKKMVIVAPTGVAAMNAKGTTINSFFQLQPGMQSIASVVSSLSYSRDKTKLFLELELLVIDEVSMVRCDVLDVIDAIFRSVRKNNAPFGGVQLLLIGDLYQLPPVCNREEWSYLSKQYASPYFFEAMVIRKNPLLQIELTTVFRQTEPEFIGILNDIRNNQISESSLALLNQRYDPGFSAFNELNPIIITSHNAEANTINQAKLDELPGQEYIFEGEISGEFNGLGFQAEQTLKLKEGSQVMFIKNDTGENRKFYNGKIGKVKSIQDDLIYISFPGEDDLQLEKTSWQSMEYKTNSEQVIVQQQVGEFVQYPIKLAWAVTIHKSQGLTFDNAIIDAGKSFVAGQVYVALSRVRTLNGLVLKSKINTESLRSNPEVIRYMKPVNEASLEALLVKAEEKYILELVLANFSFQNLLDGLESIVSTPEIEKAHLPEFKLLLAELQKSVINISGLSDRFKNQVYQIHDKEGFQDQQVLQDRIESAVTYFSKELSIQLINPVIKNIRIKPKNKLQQQIQHLLQKYRQVIENRIMMMQYAAGLLKEPIKIEDYKAWISKQKAQISTQPDAGAGTKQVVNLQLF
jgi:ATP-dependent DNA helicase PIF1